MTHRSGVGDIRLVCLSDLHLGAENSILSALAPGTTRVDPRMPSPALVGLVDCLRALVALNEGDEPPALVLLGDALDLALGQDAAAMEVFSRFVELAFAPGQRLFGDTVYYVPGNHDHHLWETTRERQFAAYLAQLPPGEPIEEPWHSTRLFAGAPPAVQSLTLLNLFHRYPHLRDVQVPTGYPNLALSSKDGTRCVLLHHGHYVESLYRLMSELDEVAFPSREPPQEVWDLEAENYAWIEFVWSTLGQSAQFGEDVCRIYDMLQSAPAMERLADRIARQVANTRYRGISRLVVRWALDLALGEVGRRAASMERLSTTGPVSPATRAGVVSYLEGPLLRQLRRETSVEVPVAFVFGHTHKPYVERIEVPGYPGPLDVYNSGGWVVDSLAPAEVRGGSVVVLDDDLDVAAVRLYRQEADATAYRVAVESAEPARPGSLAARLTASIDPSAPPWATFSATAASVVAEREKVLARIISRAGSA